MNESPFEVVDRSESIRSELERLKNDPDSNVSALGLLFETFMFTSKIPPVALFDSKGRIVSSQTGYLIQYSTSEYDIEKVIKLAVEYNLLISASKFYSHDSQGNSRAILSTRLYRHVHSQSEAIATASGYEVEGYFDCQAKIFRLLQ